MNRQIGLNFEKRIHGPQSKSDILKRDAGIHGPAIGLYFKI